MKKVDSKKGIFIFGLYSTLIIILIGVLTLTFTSCEKEENVDMDGTGMLSFKIRTWSTYSTKSTGSGFNASYVWNVIDMRSYKYNMKFTTDEIKEGMSPSSINWVTAYTSNDFKLDSERDFQFELPAGKYKGFALSMGNDFFWVISDGNKTVEIGDSNGSESSITDNIFGTNGFFEVVGGSLKNTHPGEKIGTNFTILPGKKYSIIMRMNFDKMSWSDNDNNGIWSTGDTHSDPSIHQGTGTMWDFIFKEI